MIGVILLIVKLRDRGFFIRSPDIRCGLISRRLVNLDDTYLTSQGHFRIYFQATEATLNGHF
jgi:hypothetical protein